VTTDDDVSAVHRSTDPPSPGVVTFRYEPDIEGFLHDRARDLHLLASWDHRPGSAAQLEDRVESSLPIVGRYRVEWSSTHTARNLERLRQVWPSLPPPAGHADRAPSLHLLVVEDPAGRYGYLPDTGGRIRLTNLAVRRLTERSTAEVAGGTVTCATDHVNGFLAGAALLLGPQLLAELVAGGTNPSTLTQREADLVGAEGWADLQELFRVLSWSVPYVLLRSRGSLLQTPIREVGDVDLLCASPAVVAAVANATKLSPDPFNAGHRCTVDGEPLRLDLHAVGDGYYDARWQSEMLERAALSDDGIVTPRADDLFFSLLYHVKLHKSSVARHHRDRLCGLAPRIGLALEPPDLDDDDEVARLLGGYLVASSYPVAEPRDRAVAAGLQRPFVQRLRRMDLLPVGSVRFARHQVALRSVAAMRGPRGLLAHPRLRPVMHRLRRVLVRLGW